jgi:hypothetical protein
MRTARVFERDPFLATFIVADRSQQFDRASRVWKPLVSSESGIDAGDDDSDEKSMRNKATGTSDSHAAKGRHVDNALMVLTRELTGGGLYYRPGGAGVGGRDGGAAKVPLLTGLVRSQFRKKGSESSSNGVAVDGVDLAFAALRYLSHIQQVGQHFRSPMAPTPKTTVRSNPKAIRGPDISSDNSDKNTVASYNKGNPEVSKKVPPRRFCRRREQDYATVVPGSCLVSHPLLFSLRLTQAVVVIASSDTDKGTVGFIVNKPMGCTLGKKKHMRMGMYINSVSVYTTGWLKSWTRMSPSPAITCTDPAPLWNHPLPSS